MLFEVIIHVTNLARNTPKETLDFWNMGTNRPKAWYFGALVLCMTLTSPLLAPHREVDIQGLTSCCPVLEIGAPKELLKRDFHDHVWSRVLALGQPCRELLAHDSEEHISFGPFAPGLPGRDYATLRSSGPKHMQRVFPPTISSSMQGCVTYLTAGYHIWLSSSCFRRPRKAPSPP